MTADASLDVPAPASTGREVAPVAVLRTEGLTIRFGGLTALDNVNFEIQHGEIRAIIGPNGAGKHLLQLPDRRAAPLRGAYSFQR